MRREFLSLSRRPGRAAVAVVRRGHEVSVDREALSGGSRSQNFGPRRAIVARRRQSARRRDLRPARRGGLERKVDPGPGRAGWLQRLHRGVYLVGPLETPHTARDGGGARHRPA